MILKGYANVRLSTPQYWAVWALLKIVAGVYLMVGLTPFVRLAFPPKPKETEDVTEKIPNADSPTAAAANGRSMDTRMIFDLIVKSVGLIVLLYGVESLLDILLDPSKTPDSKAGSKERWLMSTIVQILVGLAMLRGITPLVDFAFPGAASKSESEVGETLTGDEDHDS